MPSPWDTMMQRMRYELSLAANITRQDAAAKAIDYYNGKQLDHLDDLLAEQFSDPKSLRMQLGVDNVTRFVVDEISRVFDSAPTMTCDNANGQALIDSLTDDGVLAVTLKVAECYANLAQVCGLYVWWDERAQAIKTTPIPSSSLFVAQRQDDPTEAEAVVFTRELANTVAGNDTVQYVHWDDESHFIFDKAGVYYAPSATNPDKVNPYGIIPFAWMRDQLAIGSFFGDADDTLTNAQERLNVIMTEINQLMKYQAFSQPVIVGIDSKTPIAVDPSRPIRIPSALRDETPGDFRFVTPDSKIGDLIAAAREITKNLMARYGISIQALEDGGKVLSGASQKVANARLDRRRIDAIPLARMTMLQWWEVVKRVNNTHNPAQQIPLDAQIMVDFPEPTYPEDAASTLSNDEKRINLGLVSPVDLIMRDNPDLDEPQAVEKYNANRTFVTRANARYGLAALISTPTPQAQTSPTKPTAEQTEQADDNA
jgi:hypothetical protein